MNTLYPRGATNANWFSLFNAISFQITLGSPMILYAKSLGASATVLGIIASLTPLLTVCQIPAMRFIPQFGYRRFIIMGWGSRTLLIFVIAAVPLLSFLNNMGKVALLLFLLFGYNLLRGLASGAWLPWITDLIPEPVRGRFLSRDQLFLHLGCLGAMILAAGVLQGETRAWQFSVIFLISALTGGVSLLFLQRIPDIDAPESVVRSNTRVPWKEIVTYPPFLKLSIFNVLYMISLGSLSVFSVAFLKAHGGFDESTILAFTGLAFVAAVISLPIVGRILDTVGSKVVLQFALGLFSATLLVWVLIAAQVIRATVPLLAIVHLASGMAGANFGLANVRIVMNTMPPMGRSHFFAFYSVITSIGLGLTPIVWGLSLDAVGPYQAWWHGIEWNRFSMYFGALLALTLATMIFGTMLREKGPPRPAVQIPGDETGRAP